MKPKSKKILISTFVALGIIFISERIFFYLENTKNSKFDKELHEKQRAAELELNKAKDRSLLISEIDHFKACNGNKDCESLYPKAEQAIMEGTEKANKPQDETSKSK